MDKNSRQPTNPDRREDKEEEEDFYNVAIHQSGCADQHYALQDCYSERGDWRQCVLEMRQFKECMATQRKPNNTKHTVK